MSIPGFDFKFKSGEIITAKPGKSVKVLSTLLSWVSMGSIEDFVIDELDSENTGLIIDIWDDIELAPAAYECMINGKIGYIFINKNDIDSNENVLIKVN